MAKRAIQLQADLQTDEDFLDFLNTKGLLVIEVYSEWCGPCLSVLSTFMRIKLNVGELISFAIAKCETISFLIRFNKHSEPAWLFVNEGRAVNIMFGTDNPNLVNLIYHELGLLSKFDYRDHYSIGEPLPEEINRNKKKNAIKVAKLQKETLDRQRKKIDYFKYVTDTIEENLPDIGVSILGPHIHRDVIRKIIDIGMEKFGIQCKDRVRRAITKEQFEIINTVCKNPMPSDAIEAMDGQEYFACFWKIPDGESKRNVCEVLEAFAEEITKPKVYFTQGSEIIEPPLISSIKIDVEYELPEDQECPEDSKPEPIPKVQNEIPQEDDETNFEESPSEMDREEGEESPDVTRRQSIQGIDFNGMDYRYDIVEEEEEEEPIVEGPKKNICTKKVTIPGIWVPKDERTHWAAIYALFRNQTESFLPPDPVAEPPHVVMAFNTNVQNDLLDFAERHKDDVPLYGYFTSDDADEAILIANSKQNYARKAKSFSDKLVLKVHKQTSHTMLSLVAYGPTYVSFDTKIGQKEARKFFPEGYITAEQEIPEITKESKKLTSKKGKVLPKKASIESVSNKRKSDDKIQTAKEVAEEEISEEGHESINGENVDISELGEEEDVEIGDTVLATEIPAT